MLTRFAIAPRDPGYHHSARPWLRRYDDYADIQTAPRLDPDDYGLIEHIRETGQITSGGWVHHFTYAPPESYVAWLRVDANKAERDQHAAIKRSAAAEQELRQAKRRAEFRRAQATQAAAKQRQMAYAKQQAELEFIRIREARIAEQRRRDLEWVEAELATAQRAEDEANYQRKRKAKKLNRILFKPTPGDVARNLLKQFSLTRNAATEKIDEIVGDFVRFGRDEAEGRGLRIDQWLWERSQLVLGGNNPRPWG